MEYVLYFGIGLVVGTVILIISMIVTSSLMGGIDFGQVHLVLAKSVPLLLAVYALQLAPYGRLLAIPVWWIGLMVIFGLDFWEARTLVFVNWLLNVLASFAVFALLHSLAN